MRMKTALILCTIAGLLASCALATSALAGSGFVLARWPPVGTSLPAKKYGANIEYSELGGGVMQAAENGDAITYLTSGPFEGRPRASTGPEHQQILSQREPNGHWSTQDIVTPHKGIGAVPGRGLRIQSGLERSVEELAEPAGETELTPAEHPHTPGTYPVSPGQPDEQHRTDSSPKRTRPRAPLRRNIQPGKPHPVRGREP